MTVQLIANNAERGINYDVLFIDVQVIKIECVLWVKYKIKIQYFRW